MRPRTFRKQPWEELTKATDFSEEVPAGVTVSSATISAKKKSDGSPATSDVLASGTGGTDGQRATWKVKAGVSGQDYQITVQATMSNGDKFEEDVTMEVREQ